MCFQQDVFTEMEKIFVKSLFVELFRTWAKSLVFVKELKFKSGKCFIRQIDYTFKWSNSVLTVNLSVSLSFLWLVLPVASSITCSINEGGLKIFC